MANPVYLHVTLKVRAEKRQLFFDTMARAVPIIETFGWNFIGAWIDRVGRLNTVVDLWELEDANMYFDAMAAFQKHPDYETIGPALDEAIEEEVVHMMTKVPYGRR